MANGKNDMVMWAILGILVYALFIQKAPAVMTDGQAGINLCDVVQPKASFTGQRMFLSGTQLTSDYVRVIKVNGMTKDLGQVSMNSGSINTDANGKYALYFGIDNSTTYYATKEDYTAPCQEATDNKVGVMCAKDTAPTVVAMDQYGQVQGGPASMTNAQDIDADQEKTVKVRLTAAADKCFGNPGVTMDNAVCFKYNTSLYLSVETNTGKQVTPYNVANNASVTGMSIACYKMAKVADNGEIEIPVTIKATSTDPGNVAGSNISVMFKDVDMTLNADDLSEIVGFEDEDNNNIGSQFVNTTIIIAA